MGGELVAADDEDPPARRRRRPALRREVVTAGTPQPSGVSCPRCGAEHALADERRWSRHEWLCLECGHRW